MPKLPHEALVQLVRAAPEMVAELIRPSLGGALPDAPISQVSAQITAAELVNLDLPEYRADAVIVLGDPTAPTEAFVVEVQGEPAPRKRRVWPFYVAGFGVRHDCPVTLVVLALEPEVATWCREPIDLGRGRGFIHPLVIGPTDIPVITDAEVAAASPELAVLSVAAHGREPGAEHIAVAALAACRHLDNQDGLHYADFVLALLGEFARKALHQIMQLRGDTNPFFSEEFRQRYAEGVAEGEAKSLLKLVRRRGWAVSAELEAEVMACRDEAQLDLWLDRVLTAATLADVFAV